jgi:hypothetical protein
MMKMWASDVILVAQLPDGSNTKYEFNQVKGTTPEICRERAIALLYEQLAQDGVEGPVPIMWARMLFHYES